MTEEELEIQYQERLPFILMFCKLLRYGLSIFEPDGWITEDRAVGVEWLLDLRTHFEQSPMAAPRA